MTPRPALKGAGAAATGLAAGISTGEGGSATGEAGVCCAKAMAWASARPDRQTAKEGNRRSTTTHEETKETRKTGNHFPRKSMPKHAEAYPDPKPASFKSVRHQKVTNST
jgi:hypothetical protein